MAGSEIVKSTYVENHFCSGKQLNRHQPDIHKTVKRNFKKLALESFKQTLEVIIGVGIATAVIISLGVNATLSPKDPLL